MNLLVFEFSVIKHILIRWLVNLKSNPSQVFILNRIEIIDMIIIHNFPGKA